MSESMFEPGGIEPGDQLPPSKLEFQAAAYGWLTHVHYEVEDLLARMQHVHDSIEEARRELELFVPEEMRESAVARATTRRDAMVMHPLPPFPEAPARDSGIDTTNPAGDQLFKGPEMGDPK